VPRGLAGFPFDKEGFLMPALAIDSKEWMQMVRDGAKEMGVLLDLSMAKKMAVHCTELMRWNQKVNLTAITDPMEVAVKHLLDSLAAYHLLPGDASVLDVGSGGGFPGLVLKIANPGLFVALVDASRKKVSFLKHVIRVLSLTRIEAIHARVGEIVWQEAFAQRFDAAACRAFTSLSGFVEMAAPLVKKGGILVAYKGKDVDEEIKGLGLGPSGSKIKDGGNFDDFSLEILPYRLPYLHVERALVVVKKNRAKDFSGNEGNGQVRMEPEKTA
jgi:16S rRNA (guanine527-N7)-methyltransferase